jgi:hypothetical protein
VCSLNNLFTVAYGKTFELNHKIFKLQFMLDHADKGHINIYIIIITLFTHDNLLLYVFNIFIYNVLCIADVDAIDLIYQLKSVDPLDVDSSIINDKHQYNLQRELIKEMCKDKTYNVIRERKRSNSSQLEAKKVSITTQHK